MDSLFRAIDVFTITSGDIVEAAAYSIHSLLAPSVSPSPSSSSQASTSSSTSSNQHSISSHSDNNVLSSSPLLSQLIPSVPPRQDPQAQNSIVSDIFSPKSDSSNSGSPSVLSKWFSDTVGSFTSGEKAELRFRGMTKEEIDQLLWGAYPKERANQTVLRY